MESATVLAVAGVAILAVHAAAWSWYSLTEFSDSNRLKIIHGNDIAGLHKRLREVESALKANSKRITDLEHSIDRFNEFARDLSRAAAKSLTRKANHG